MFIAACYQLAARCASRGLCEGANTFVRKRNARQVFVERLLRHKKTAVSIDHHCSLVLKLLVKPFEGDGFLLGAGDGARTRDSLLGRQGVTVSPLA